MKKLNIFSSKRTSLNSQNGDGSPSAPTNTLGRIVNAKEVVCIVHCLQKVFLNLPLYGVKLP